MSRRRVHQLKVDWPNCTGRGVCHGVLPELIDLDPWGYPIITGPVTEELLPLAREAVRMCPQLALRLTSTP